MSVVLEDLLNFEREFPRKLSTPRKMQFGFIIRRLAKHFCLLYPLKNICVDDRINSFTDAQGN